MEGGGGFPGPASSLPCKGIGGGGSHVTNHAIPYPRILLALWGKGDEGGGGGGGHFFLWPSGLQCFRC